MTAAYAAEWFESIDRAGAAEWTHVTGPGRLLLQPRYLAALEAAAPPRMRFAYCMLRQGRTPVGVAAVQRLSLTGDAVGRRAPGPGGLAAGVVRAVQAAARGIRFPVRLCGNTFASSEDGFAFAAGVDAPAAANALVDAMGRRAAAAGGGIDAFVIPDADDGPAAAAVRRALREAGFLPFETDPTMVVALAPGVRSVAEYVAGMRGKYRARYRRIRRLGAPLQRLPMGPAEIAAHEPRVQQLVDAVADRSSLRGSDIPPAYFTQMQRRLGDAFHMTGYQLDGRLVGVGSTLATPAGLVGSFLGIEYERNATHALYQNILWDYVERGITLGVPRVSLGRTASAIKSTLGARPHPVWVYVRWHDGDLTRLLTPLFHLVKPPEWTPRHPFPAPGGR
ncbi:MAG: GNAT family N-acetyltransferase [Planctomycetota bacterium]